MKITWARKHELVLNAAQVAFLCIAAFTALNGLFDSLWCEFVFPPDMNHLTFLDLPYDLYGDLLKPSFVSPPFVQLDTTGWPGVIAFYYHHNAYVPQNLQMSSQIVGMSFLHVTPITLMAHILIKKLLLGTSPQVVVALFISAAVLGLAAVCRVLTPNWGTAAFTFLVLGLSYPFIMIVSRGNIGALVNGITVNFFFYFVLTRKWLWPAVACLAVAAFFRPNVLALCPVLLALGFWRACFGSAMAVAALALAYCLFFWLDAQAYPGYGLAVHLAALKTYATMYIVGPGGDQFNSSAYGAIKALVCWWHGRNCADIGDTLQTVNLGIALLFGAALLVVIGLYLSQRLSAFTFAFAVLACFALSTTIFGVYHLLVFAAFPLLLLQAPAGHALGRPDRLVLIASVLVLVPKNYLFIASISVETLINPLVLGYVLAWLIYSGFRKPLAGPLFSSAG